MDHRAAQPSTLFPHRDETIAASPRTPGVIRRELTVHRVRRTNSNYRPPRWIPLGWASAFLLALLVAAPPAEAAHRHVPDENGYVPHLNEMHWASAGDNGPGGNDEQYCVQSHDTSVVGHTTARNFVRETLVGLDFDKIWDGTGNWKIDLWYTQNPCSSYSGSTRESIEIEYHYGHNWNFIPTCGGTYGYYNCVEFAQPTYNSTYGHYDYTKGKVYLVFSSGGQLNTRGRAFINHETGHIWGLKDPNYSGHCPTPSIMHGTAVGYGCTNWTAWYPSQYDFASVKTVMAGG
jgi:hypothetical protein